MRKLILILLVILAVCIASIYLLIPSSITVSSAEVVKTPDVAAERYIIDEHQWSRWWNYSEPNAASPEGSVYRNRDYSYRQTGKFYKSIDIAIEKDGLKLSSKLLLIPLSVDSTGIEWKTELPTGANPIARLMHYFEAKKLKQNMDGIMDNLKSFLSKTENVYGISIEKSPLKDTLYVSTKQLFTVYPSIKDIYQLVDKIKNHITQNGTQATGSPIYNITRMDKDRYQLMTAVPTDRSLKETGVFSMKYMVKGSFMITEVLGGENQVHEASRNMQQYFQDYRKTSMAMNFTMLVTDRMLQPDSSKWVTKLCMPVY